ncbi:FAD-dependent monooxygenase [Erythrobacter sp.]|uniref:FAD-dependent monooxygenase n=1 Tax=Erythrobacter sp. TaxID=1042 RepID=UPI001425FD9D|nr:FAD-dependent monooxygenase [Erythrobacter sp.]QIQ86578.1 MAG: NAD(P)-binding protein [Erythrobacter sp.]
MRIAIIGGGVGGLTAGIALRQAGFDPVIYERAEAFGEVGAGISLSPNAVKGLEALGLGAFLEAHANEPLDQFLFHWQTGEELLRYDRRRTRGTYGGAYYQMHRADLLAGLIEAFGGDCVMGAGLERIEQDAPCVRLAFEDGREAEADVAIAADGLRSAVRGMLFDAASPRFSGHVAWRALIPAERLPQRASEPASVNHIGPGRNLVTYPVRGRALVNMVALTRSDEWAEESWNARAAPHELAALFDGWTGYVREVIDAIPADALYRWGLFVREPLASWVSGRIALLGDAAHPMLPYMGQGASSTIEDAVVLGRCFAAAPADPGEALRLYEAARIARASFLQSESNLGGDRLQALDPYALRDNPPQNEDALGIFSYDPARCELA